ncbi:MAG: DUF72 domain-containing protein [Desulfobacteraceae bacterium]|nr:DUF72 domain-containing protein [Desulfobacteraceae bacterium]
MGTSTNHQTQNPPCRLMIGTSGYSYTEWIDGGFYPPGTSSSRMLPLYAATFSATELNYTWYQMPKAPAVDRMRRKVPANFSFAAKLTRTMTHEVNPGNWRGQAAQYRDGIAPLVQSGQLAAILIQLPPYFDRSPGNRRYLAALLDDLDDLPLAVEFRHRSWAEDRVFAELEQRRVALVAVDEPDLPGLFPKLDVVTNPDLFYLRFHGRNAKGWRSGNMQQQFDYNYTDSELSEWTGDKIETMARKACTGLIFFNNHVRAQAPGNAGRLAEQLAANGLLVSG